MAYHNGNGGSNGGSNGDGPVINLPDSGDIQYSWADSAYQFTNPPRYYKANDPYYYEIDNIPLKQIQENCLWLRDQITGGTAAGGGGGTSTSGIYKSDIQDLKPTVTNNDRDVTVLPGNYISRVNSNNGGAIPGYWESGPQQEIDFLRDNILAQPGFALNLESYWNQLIAFNDIGSGSDWISPFGAKANGLLSNYTFQGTASLHNGGIDNPVLPLNQYAMWKTIVSGTRSLTGSADLDMSFRRRYQGIFRTAVVNVPEPLTVQIPPFSASDWMDNSTGTSPVLRIDLLCILSYHLDDDGNVQVPSNHSGSTYYRNIDKAELVLVKGAGGILAPKAGMIGIANNPENITLEGGPMSPENLFPEAPGYYDLSGGLQGDATRVIKANLQDQILQGASESGPLMPLPPGSFPSPDDLLNLAPRIAEGLIGVQTVGQTALPIAYIIVREGEPTITEADIIDIRPFLRTTELAYNERAGIAAANPPLSWANPAVGKGEMYTAFEASRENMQTYVQGQTGNKQITYTTEERLFFRNSINLFWGVNAYVVGNEYVGRRWRDIDPVRLQAEVAAAGLENFDTSKIKYFGIFARTYSDNGANGTSIYVTNGGNNYCGPSQGQGYIGAESEAEPGGNPGFVAGWAKSSGSDAHYGSVQEFQWPATLGAYVPEGDLAYTAACGAACGATVSNPTGNLSHEVVDEDYYVQAWVDRGTSTPGTFYMCARYLVYEKEHTVPVVNVP